MSCQVLLSCILSPAEKLQQIADASNYLAMTFMDVYAPLSDQAIGNRKLGKCITGDGELADTVDPQEKAQQK